ncbi:MAG: hypothetical protein NUV49_02670 [Patescibacteria group bacterium]|nr:hypothetical protein [Patescibacteria group bacterium]
MKIFDIKNIGTYVSALFLFTVLFTLPHFLSVFTVSEDTTAAGIIGMEKEREDPFQNLFLQGKAFFVYDVNENAVLYAKNEETQFPLASLTKIMTALIAKELSPEGMLITIDSSAIETEGDSGLLIGERWRLKDIIDFTLVSSSNDGARALASLGSLVSQDEGTLPEESFVRQMNDKARSVGLQQTYFLNESGLDVNSSTSGAYGSAKDMALLFAYVLDHYPELLEATTESALRISSLSVAHVASNTNDIVGSIPGILASKTGFTELAGGNLVVAFEAGPTRTIVIAVLGSTVDGRFNDMEKLILTSLEAIK